MSDIHEPVDTDHDHGPGPSDGPGKGSAARAGRKLPVGPFALLAMTAIALLGAFGVTTLVVDAANDNDAVDLQEALNGQAVAPLVSDSTQQAEIGSPAPNVRLDFLGGDTAQLAEIAGTGTPVVLNFWSSTCAPCVNEMPAIETVSQQVGDRMTIIGIDSQDTVESGEKMVEQTGVTYRNARDPQAQISTVFGALVLPRTVLIDADGTVVAMHSGELNVETFTELLGENGFPTP